MDDRYNLVFTLAAIALSALVGLAIGNGKGRPTAGLIWGFVLGPIGWLIVAVSPAAMAHKAKPCPYCLGAVPLNQSVCAHCSHPLLWLRGTPRKPAGSATAISH